MGTKNVLITGGSRGIGRSAVLLFADLGYRVKFCYNQSEHQAQELVSMNKERITAVKCNVSNIDEVQSLFNDENEKIDILVNNAGVAVAGLFHELKQKELESLYGVNLFGTLNFCRAAIPSMVKRKSGVIINVASVWGEVGASNEVDYSVTKAGVIGLTKALAKELAPSGIRVNCVSPGVIDTDMNCDISYDDMCLLRDSIPLERIGDPADVAKAIIFLASDEASYITGQVLSVGGGFCG